MQRGVEEWENKEIERWVFRLGLGRSVFIIIIIIMVGVRVRERECVRYEPTWSWQSPSFKDLLGPWDETMMMKKSQAFWKDQTMTYLFIVWFPQEKSQ